MHLAVCQETATVTKSSPLDYCSIGKEACLHCDDEQLAFHKKCSRQMKIYSQINHSHNAQNRYVQCPSRLSSINGGPCQPICVMAKELHPDFIAVSQSPHVATLCEFPGNKKETEREKKRNFLEKCCR
ncbi:hypothetical protein CEXT_103531 [Caerostris extrusa]|uniref:Uncharacterized protein n=1 Tax=Caerostris extrusa TaxID=172846 RepID=A0AAV4QZQ6_CAEEX|nr:hypothetical protein CEXT_103531 [Caerostris extrusa]